jgi:hypothetical protein
MVMSPDLFGSGYSPQLAATMAEVAMHVRRLRRTVIIQGGAINTA